jgi:ABC-type multidrug transport system permease subunit
MAERQDGRRLRVERRDSGVSHPLIELTRARFREFLREPEAVFWVFAFPVLLTLALGVAFRAQPAARALVGIVSDAGPSADFEALSAALKGSTDIEVRSIEMRAVDVSLRNGTAQVVVLPGSPPTYRFDPARPESQLARLIVDRALQRAAGRQDVWTAQEQPVMTPGGRYVDWLVPGLLGMNIMGTSLWSIGFSVVQARTRKLLKRLMATPMRRTHYLLSHVFSRLLFLALEAVAIVGFGVLAFGVPVLGSVWSLTLVCLIGALSFGGLGLLLASRPKTIEGISGLMNVAMLPMWVLSGVFFSSASFPAVMQPAIKALPLTALNEALRGVMLDGASLAGIWSQLAILSAWGAGCFALAVATFRWR